MKIQLLNVLKENKMIQRWTHDNWTTFGLLQSNWEEKAVPSLVNIAEPVARRCSLKKVFLEISQNSQGNTCAGVSFLIKFFY